MTDHNTTCPSGLVETEYSKRTCSRGCRACNSVTFPVSGGEYSQVCGGLKAYQWGITNGPNHGGYFSGVSVTHAWYSPSVHLDICSWVYRK